MKFLKIKIINFIFDISFRNWPVLLFAILCSIQGYGQNPIVLSNENESFYIGKDVSILVDSSKSLTIEDVRSASWDARFKKCNQEIPNLGYSDAAIWCKFTIVSLMDEAIFMEINKPILDSLTLYVPTASKKFIEIRTGSKMPFYSRHFASTNFIFQIWNHRSNVKKVPHTYYFRVVSASNLTFPIKVGAIKPISHSLLIEIVCMCIYFGITILSIIYNLCIFFIFKDKTYLYYVLYILLLGLYIFYAQGYAKVVFTDSSVFDSYFYTLNDIGGIFVILFAIKFLRLKTYKIQLYKAYLFVVFIYSILSVADVLGFTSDYFYEYFFNYFDLLVWYSLLISGIFSYYKGNVSSIFFVTGWFIFINCLVIYDFSVVDIIPYSGYTSYLIPIGSFFELLLFGIGLTYKFYALRIENEKALNELISVKENNNKVLEEKVNERTRELQESQMEILAQNEELSQQQDQLAEQRDLLEKHNGKLEEIIRHRTQQLLDSNKALLENNNQLEQFAFMAAHNLRAPVARIMGLGILLKLVNIADEEREFIIMQLMNSTQELDSVIKDLNLILEIRYDTKIINSEIYISDSTKKIINLLNKEIAEKQAVISEDYSGFDKINSFSPYIESILLNLFSNALKYSHPNRIPEIKLSTRVCENGEYCISVSDNGIGIDLELYGSKIFTLYKRFHTHVEGKGLGLYLVKNQILALGGEIKIESMVNVGTTVEIFLKGN